MNEKFIVKFENFGENQWYIFKIRAFRVALLDVLWVTMGFIGGMAMQELNYDRWASDLGTIIVLGKDITFIPKFFVFMLSFILGFCFALIPEGAVISFIASGDSAKSWRVFLGTMLSILLSVAASTVFINSDLGKNMIWFIIAMSFVGQFFVVLISGSLTQNRTTEAIAEKETEMATIRRNESKKRVKAATTEKVVTEDNEIGDLVDKTIPFIPTPATKRNTSYSSNLTADLDFD